MSVDRLIPEVLVVDDEAQIRRLLRVILEESSYCVREAETGSSALADIQRRSPDLIILDIGLPDCSGLEVLKTIRDSSQIPVLILSVFGQEKNKIAALDAGADDYLTKPFSGGELLARIRALQRRIKPGVASNIFRFGTVEIDLGRRSVSKEGQSIALTSTEYALLQLFILHRDKVLTHRQILRELWGPKAENQTHYLRTYMLRLRRKLEDNLDTPKFFKTDSGIGYRFVTEPNER